MKDKRRRSLLTLGLVLAGLCLIFFIFSVAMRAASARREQRLITPRANVAEEVPPAPSAVQPILTESDPPVVDNLEAPLPEAILEYSDAATQAAYEVAGLYQELYGSLYSGGGMVLNSDDAAAIMELINAGGYVAADRNRQLPMLGAAEAEAFISAAKAGDEGRLAIYELCLDAGFICHTLHFYGGEYYLTRTRLAWLQSAGSGLQGATPTVTYSDAYRLTELYIDGDSLYYDYTVPNNPSGTNHDGHIDTETYIYIGS